MQKEIENLIQKAKADYIKFACAGERGMPKEGSYFASEIANFEDSFEIKEGKKYIKLVRKNGGVWGFIVKEDGPKFKKGDILKPLVTMLQLPMPLVATFLKNIVLLGLVHITWCNMKQEVLWRVIHCAIIGVFCLIPIIAVILIF